MVKEKGKEKKTTESKDNYRKLRPNETAPKAKQCSKTGCTNLIGKQTTPEEGDWLIVSGSYNGVANTWFCPECEAKRRGQYGKRRWETQSDNEKPKRVKKRSNVICGIPGCTNIVGTVFRREITLKNTNIVKIKNFGYICEECNKKRTNK